MKIESNIQTTDSAVAEVGAQKAVPSLSVIVPVFNGEKFIGRCLDAILASDTASLEVIVVNDGSTDATQSICEGKGVTILQSSRPRSGPAAARNLAAATALGDVLVFVDADVVVSSTAIGRIAARFGADEGLAALFGSYDDAPAESNFLSQYKNLQHHFVHQHSNPNASTFWAGLGAIRKNIFLSMGGFDCVQFEIPSIEDIELGARLRKGRNPILLDPTIQGKHLKRWGAYSLLYTDIFCRAAPWSKLIMRSQGLINDMNLKTNDRACAAIVAAMILSLLLSFWYPLLFVVATLCLIAFAFLNRAILTFYLQKKGWLFAFMTLPWQIMYFFYSGVTFVTCWFLYSVPASLGLIRRQTN